MKSTWLDSMNNVVGITDGKYLKEAQHFLDNFEDVIDTVIYSKLPSQAKQVFVLRSLNLVTDLEDKLKAAQEGLRYEHRD